LFLRLGPVEDTLTHFSFAASPGKESVLLDQPNPYDDIPDILKLEWDDFECGLSAQNEKALDVVADWTVVAYMAADCNLAPYMFDDLLAMKQVGSSDRVHVLAWFDGPLVTDAFFARLNAGTSLADDTILRFHELRTNDQATLTMALQVASAYRARHRLLLLGGHGSGWRGVLLDQNLGMRYMKEPGKLVFPGPVAECEARLRGCMLKAQDQLNAVIVKLEHNNSLYDILGLDACYMGNIEAVAPVASQANLLIVSEDMVPGEGFAYKSFLSDLVQNPAQTPTELAKQIVERTRQFYAEKDEVAREITLSALVTAELPAFSDAFLKLAQQLGPMVQTPELLVELESALENAWSFSGTGTIDLPGFVHLLLNGKLPEETRAAAEEVLACWGRLSLSFTGGGTPTTSNGLSVYAPSAESFEVAYIEASNQLPLNFGIWAWFLGDYFLHSLGDRDPSHPLLQALQQTMNKLIATGEYKPGAGNGAADGSAGQAG
jgi:hypothetical protein